MKDLNLFVNLFFEFVLIDEAVDLQRAKKWPMPCRARDSKTGQGFCFPGLQNRSLAREANPRYKTSAALRQHGGARSWHSMWSAHHRYPASSDRISSWRRLALN